MNAFMNYCFCKLLSLRRDNDGFVVMFTLALFLLLFVFCASVYAVAETIHQRIRLQNACDAAAYSAAVVQADGLSRMATVNQALAWTYVQMTNHQMDYITYRWLRLTVKRYDEDKANAEGYHAFIVLNFNLNYGIYSVIAMGAEILMDRWIGFFCEDMQLRCSTRHDKVGKGWWAGQGPTSIDYLKLNGHSFGDSVHRNTVNEFLCKLDGVPVTPSTNTPGNSGNSSEPAEIKAINDKYDKLESELPIPDANDPDFEQKKAEYFAKISDLKQKRAKEISDWRIKNSSQVPDIAAKMQKINEEYDKMIADLKKPDENDPNYEKQKADYDAEVARINEERNRAIAALSSNDSTPVTGGTSPFEDGAWGENMRAAIGGDKIMISQLNDYHAVINQTMEETMKTVAEFVLAQMLRDPRLPDEDALKKYYRYVYIPKGFDPYSAGSGETDDQEQINSETQAGAVSNIFAPLYNTEPYERIFLQYATAEYSDQPLYVCFPEADTQNSSSKGGGLDQWFVRTGVAEDGNGVRQRTEGALGIQRGYKDANLNETNAGIYLRGKKIDRGNHIMNLFLGGAGLVAEDTNLVSTGGSGGGLLADFMRSIFGNLFDTLQSELFDITASCGNARSEDYFIPICSAVDENVSLYSEYEWSSAKWLCLADPEYGSIYLEYLICSHGYDEVRCNSRDSETCMVIIEHKGKGHYHIPKWFCGKFPRFERDNHCTDPKKDAFAQMTLFDMLPPLGVLGGKTEIEENKHGYMEKTTDFSEFKRPFDDVFKKEQDRKKVTRSTYESCTPFIDGMLMTLGNFGTGDKGPGLINGHARIYGDDKEVWDANTYVGKVAKPWVLSENFFSGAGTIVVGVAMKHENPFVQMLTMLQQDGRMINGKSVLSAFDPPSYKGLKVNGDRISAGNCIWTMSAARAGVRRTRRNGAFDQERMYQVTYDPTSDPENMVYAEKNGPYIYRTVAGTDGKASWEKYGDGETHSPACVIGGCVCSGNADRLRYVWNLCETDWDATLLPLRYAGAAAQLKNFENSATYGERKQAFSNMDLQNYSGDGKNWTWAPASTNTSAGNENPMNPGSGSTTGWAPLDSSNTDNVKLESLLPDGEKKLNLEMLLRQNRIL